MLIEELGRGYANENLYGTYINYDGKLCRITHIDSSSIAVADVENDRMEMLPYSALAGWRSLKYPRLGYRVGASDLRLWVGRSSRSYTRGLCASNLQYQFSALTDLRRDNGFVFSQEAKKFLPEFNNSDDDYDEDSNISITNAVMSAVFMPEYDKGDKFHAMLRGDADSFVPSSRFLVEKAVNQERYPGVFAVFMDNNMLGGITAKGKVVGPIQNQKIIKDMVNRYAS